MNKKIFFCPVGGTDPMSEKNAMDGAMLHIARYYKPDVIYLYMSSEILEIHKKDNRYLKSLEWLENVVNRKFQVEFIEKPELKNVQIFNDVYLDISIEISKIVSSMEETDELILNISSGTPAMKSALLVLATMLNIKCTCVQVDTPEKKMNEHIHEKHPDIETLWDLNKDNEYYLSQDPKGNRCHEEYLGLVKKLQLEEAIIELVRAYRYQQAFELAEKLPEDYTANYLEKLKFAMYRKDLNFRETDKLKKQMDRSIYNPVKSEEANRLFEFVLALKIRATCREYGDFLRALSPAFNDILANILKKNADFDVNDYTKLDYKGRVVWDEDKLTANEVVFNTLNKAYPNGFVFGFVKSDNLEKIVRGIVDDESICRCVRDLRMVEDEVRNVAAHTMQYISDDYIEKKTGYTCTEFVNLLQKAFVYTTFNIKKEDWNSYDDMNEDIILSIRKNNDNSWLEKKAGTIKKRMRRYRHGLRPGWVAIKNTLR